MAFWDLNYNPFQSTDGKKDFFSGLWTNRSEDAYKDFFKDGWKKPKEWINPGGVMANPAQQIADPGNFLTKEEHENWVSGEGVSDRTTMSAVVAGLIYGGATYNNGLMGGEGAAGAAGAESAVGTGAGPGAGQGLAGSGAQSSGGFWQNLLSNPNNLSILGGQLSGQEQQQQSAGVSGQFQNQVSRQAAEDERQAELIEELEKKEASPLSRRV